MIGLVAVGGPHALHSRKSPRASTWMRGRPTLLPAAHQIRSRGGSGAARFWADTSAGTDSDYRHPQRAARAPMAPVGLAYQSPWDRIQRGICTALHDISLSSDLARSDVEVMQQTDPCVAQAAWPHVRPDFVDISHVLIVRALPCRLHASPTGFPAREATVNTAPHDSRAPGIADARPVHPMPCTPS